MNVQRYAKVAGVLLLISVVAGGFGEAYAPSKLIVAGDAAATVANIKSFEFIYRLGFAAFLIESFADITLALILYALLKPVSRDLSLLAAFFGLVGTALFAFAELFYLAPTLMTVGPLNAFSTDQIDELILLSLRFYQFAAMIFSGYYGIAWIVRAYLMFRSGYLPKFLGVLMGIGGFGFLARNFLLILAPAYASPLLLMLLFPGTLMLMIWLLGKGVDMPKWNARVNAQA
ncbi:MAG TPA: DUF4386 domain-containing protein [Pyrinomonadaceae bacterium]|nr:DUF4386 domain-containing protein [Pyrinomonadaceae bacterium]